MATTEILPFATAGGANVETQAAYAADPTTSTGFLAGTAASIKLNKVWRQSAFIAAGLANFMVNRGITVLDDGNLTALVAEIQAAMTAYLDKSVAGAVDVTLAPTTEANYPIIDLTGALTGNINVIVPTAAGSWKFINSTTGNFTLTVKTAAGTGIQIQQGTAIQLHCDGVNVLNSMSSALSTLAGGAMIGSVTQTETTLTDGATINWDLSLQQNAKVTLAGNRTVAAPTNLVAGKYVALRIIQDATGSRTLTWNAVYKGITGFVMSTTPNAVDWAIFRCVDATNLELVGFRTNVGV